MVLHKIAKVNGKQRELEEDFTFEAEHHALNESEDARTESSSSR